MQKRLYRATEGKMIAGVCAGVAEYFNIDPTVVRVVWAVTGCFAFAGIIAYIAAALIIPEKPKMIED
jgi:phage shock protein C